MTRPNELAKKIIPGGCHSYWDLPHTNDMLTFTRNTLTSEVKPMKMRNSSLICGKGKLSGRDHGSFLPLDNAF